MKSELSQRFIPYYRRPTFFKFPDGIFSVNMFACLKLFSFETNNYLGGEYGLEHPKKKNCTYYNLMERAKLLKQQPLNIF